MCVSPKLMCGSLTPSVIDGVRRWVLGGDEVMRWSPHDAISLLIKEAPRTPALLLCVRAQREDAEKTLRRRRR